MTPKKIDTLNILLIIISLIAAIKLPFRLFLLSYAVLGPLHYLTEINWLKKKEYFIPSKNKTAVWVLIAMTIVVCIAPVLYGLINSDPGIKHLTSETRNWLTNELVIPVSKLGDLFILAAFLSTILFLMFNDRKTRLIGSAVAIFACFLLSYLPFYRLVFVIFLPTFIHVYIFTAVFMLFGAIKSNSKPGYLSVLLLIAVPFILSLIDIDPKQIVVTPYIERSMAKSNFLYVLSETAKAFNLGGGKQMYLLSPVGLKLQAFLAFAYTYHYLNWFSKTSIIKWHKVDRKNLIISIFLWLVFVGIYIYDYQIGFVAVFVLSFLHVFLEFPLNVKSFEFIGKHLYRIAWAKKS